MHAREALSYPLRGPHTESALVVGFALGFVVAGAMRVGLLGAVFAVVPLLLLVGYLGRIAERSLDGDSTVPAVKPVGDLLRRGGRLFVVALAYAIPPVLALTLVSRFLVDMQASEFGAGDGYAFFVISTGLLLVWGIFGYLLPAAMLVVIETESLQSMVDFGKIKRLAGRETYLVTWLKAAFLFGFCFSLASIFQATDRLGGLLAVPLVVYAAYVSVYMIAGSCTERKTLW